MWLIRFYQIAISPMLPSTCRFEPSCSQYGYEAFKRHGFFRGAYLTVRRIARCNPFHEGGYDPVPDSDGNEVEAST
jgi:putative membrane protein insertion efficiency factor